jgi:hypothetical protein
MAYLMNFSSLAIDDPGERMNLTYRELRCPEFISDSDLAQIPGTLTRPYVHSMPRPEQANIAAHSSRNFNISILRARLLTRLFWSVFYSLQQPCDVLPQILHCLYAFCVVVHLADLPSDSKVPVARPWDDHLVDEEE